MRRGMHVGEEWRRVTLPSIGRTVVARASVAATPSVAG
jgi:hypothetical protein